MIIDSHHHFWKYDPVEYGWIDEEMSVIRRDFLPADLKAAIASAGIEAVVSVQATQTLAETRWLLELARHNNFIAGVVGWAPLASAGVDDELARLAADAKLKSIRHVVQGEPDGSLARADFNAGVARLARHKLAYDLLIFERQLPQAIEFVDRHSEQVFVLDHVAKPRIRDWVFTPWRENICELARRKNVYCKISGMVTEADYRAWSGEQLRQYVDVVLKAFGPARLMFGSDWPVCLVACGYRRWVELVRSFIEKLSPTEQSDIMGRTVQRAYRL